MKINETFRFVVCIDVEANSPKFAYERIYHAIAKLPTGISWESSDEAYDGNGQAIDEDVLSAARTAVLYKIHEDQ